MITAKKYRMNCAAIHRVSRNSGTERLASGYAQHQPERERQSTASQ